MYQTIVVAFDGTEAGRDALQQGAGLARLCRAELHVLGVVVSSGGLLLDPAIVPLELLDAEREVLQVAMADAVRDLGHPVSAAQTVTRDGEPAAEIVAYAREINADLVVIGHGHGHKGLLARWFESSVGTHLLEAMPCSVLVAVPSA